MNPSSVLYEPSAEGITLITINRPEVRNAVNSPTAKLLAEAFRRFETDDSQKVCILTGAGGQTFCAGYDLHEVAASPTPSPSTNALHSDNNNSRTSLTSRVKPVTTTDPSAELLQDILGPMGPSRMLLSKPLIAAVSGHAVAGGLELSLLADLRVCDTTAIFGVFCRRWGVPLIDGGTVRLPRVVGLGRALDMILTGRPVDAKEALAMGLANRVVPKGTDVVEEAKKVARSLLAFPQLCMRADRRSAYHGVYEARSLTDALRFEYQHGIDIVEKEGVKGAARFDKGQGRGGSFDLVKGKL
ncbi:hypothetical protein N0V82_008920 [Gnomoniopsis sp. IMI 355080]|nr:hypothetical protein N0V82_008920 [Gnomoniopsis sp. IMI 355080]